MENQKKISLIGNISSRLISFIRSLYYSNTKNNQISLFFFATIGLCILALDSFKFFRNLFYRGTHFFPLYKYSFKQYHTPGSKAWAVITGGSEGIGFEFARKLAELGFNIFLLARDPNKLQIAKEKLVKEYGVNVAFKSIDFSISKTKKFFDDVSKALDEIDIGILVNNIGHPKSGSFLKQSEDDIDEIMNMNVYPVLVMTRIVIEKMIKRPQKSAIINIGSFSSRIGLSKQVVYGGAKMISHSFARNMANVYKSKIDFLCEIPGIVETEALKRWSGKPILSSKPEDLVTSALKDLRITNCIDNVGYGTWRNNLYQNLFLCCFTRKWVINRVYGSTYL